MRKVKMTLSYMSPGWNFCEFEDGGMCRFCDKTRKGYICRLYDTGLMSDGVDIYKCNGCIRATAGFNTEVVDAAPNTQPTVDPKLVMKAAIELYNKSVNELLTQGYPRKLAESLAQQAVLGGSK